MMNFPTSRMEERPLCAIVFAKLLAVKKAEQLEREAGEDVLYDAEHAVERVE